MMAITFRYYQCSVGTVGFTEGNSDKNRLLTPPTVIYGSLVHGGDPCYLLLFFYGRA